MKITMDKDYTTLNNVELVKDTIREFKARYTENDVCRELGFDGEVLSLDMVAWASGAYQTESDVRFYVNRMVVDGWNKLMVVKYVSFNIEMEINADNISTTIYRPSDEC